FFFQAEDGIRDRNVTGVQTCALPIFIHFFLIGRPNVGKSSLVNAILNEERVIVSDIEGTTRDAIDTSLKRDGEEFIIIDTAGMKIGRASCRESVESTVGVERGKKRKR